MSNNLILFHGGRLLNFNKQHKKYSRTYCHGPGLYLALTPKSIAPYAERELAKSFCLTVEKGNVLNLAKPYSNDHPISDEIRRAILKYTKLVDVPKDWSLAQIHNYLIDGDYLVKSKLNKYVQFLSTDLKIDMAIGLTASGTLFVLLWNLNKILEIKEICIKDGFTHLERIEIPKYINLEALNVVF